MRSKLKQFCYSDSTSKLEIELATVSEAKRVFAEIIAQCCKGDAAFLTEEDHVRDNCFITIERIADAAELCAVCAAMTTALES